ncbi:MAG: hypothetical protein ABEJ06_04000 [Haloarculaceae archaeon]
MADADDAEAPDFEIARRPERRYPPGGGVEYEGTTVFRLVPAEQLSPSRLAALVEGVLDSPAYTYGDWFDLPMPLYLAHDERRGDVFRVGVRDGAVELHVLPATRSASLRAFYERVCDRSDAAWSVECEDEAGG